MQVRLHRLHNIVFFSITYVISWPTNEFAFRVTWNCQSCVVMLELHGKATPDTYIYYPGKIK